MSVRWKFYKNLINNFSMENEDQVTSGLAELWTKIGTPTLTISSLYKKQGIYSQKIVGDASGEGISQTIDISDITTSSFGFIFYAYIVSGSLNVKIETLDENDVVLVEVLNKTYSTNSIITKQLETFTASGSGYTQIKITFSQSGATALTCYLDSIILYEDVNTEVEINPTTFTYSKLSDAQFVNTIEGDEVKISPLEESKRVHIESFSPVWSWITVEQEEIFEGWVGKDLVIIDHADRVFWMDLLLVAPTFQEHQVPDKFSIAMELKECRR